MKLLLPGVTATWLGAALGALGSVSCGWAYFAAWDESGPAFYPFAALAFVGGPLAGGILAAWRTRGHRVGAFVAAARATFGLVFVLFAILYVVLPQFARTNVDLTAFADGPRGRLAPPADLTYVLSDGTRGILLTRDARTDVVVVIGDEPPFASTLFVVDREGGRSVRSLHFPNDVIAATIDEGMVVVYNDKLGYLLNAVTGDFEEHFLLIDNYGGLSESDRPFISRASTGRWYVETTAVLSSWRVDGEVRSRRNLTFNCIALGCFVRGDTHEVTRLTQPVGTNAPGNDRPR